MNAARWVSMGSIALLAKVAALAADTDQQTTRYVFEVFTVPLAAANDLISQDMKGSELRDKVLAVGKLDNLIVGNTSSTARIDQVEDYLYPTQTDPPQVPPLLAIVNPGPKAASIVKPPAPGSVRSPSNGGIGTLTTTTFTAFTTKSLGDRLEFDPGRGDATGRYRVMYSLESNELLAVDQVNDIPVPVFSSRKLQGKARVRHGESEYLGTYNFAQRSGVTNERGEDLTSMVFMTVRLNPREPRASEPAYNNKGEIVPSYPFTRPTLRYTFEVVSMDKTVAHPLLMDSLEDTALHDRMMALIASKQAKRETTLVARSRSGNEVTISSGNEYLYPVEFDPPQIAQQMIIANRQLLQDMRAGKQTGLGEQPPVPGGNPSGGFGLITALSPTAFQSKLLGESLKINAVENSKSVSVTLAAGITHLDGTVTYNGIGHPVFGRQEISSAFEARFDQPVLVGTLNKALNTGFPGSNKEDRVWLAFLRVTTH